MSTSIKQQIKILLRRKNFWLTLWLMFGFVAVHFVRNVIRYQGMDVSEMRNSMTIILLSYLNESGELFYLLQFLPFMLVIPAAFSFSDDLNSGEYVYIRSRQTSSGYLITKILAVALTTFVAFELPLLLELLLNSIAFPSEGMSLGEGWSIYSEVVTEYIEKLPIKKLFIFSPFLYSLLMGIKFSLMCSVMAVFTMVCSTIGVRVKVFLFLPVYILLYAIAYSKKIIGIPFETNYYYYFPAYYSGNANWLFVVCVLLIMGVCSAFFCIRYVKSDCI